MTLGQAPRQADLFRSTAGFCEPRVAPDSIYGLLYRECYRLFGDEMFADLFTDVGRRSVPPMIVAVVMVLQRVEGCSDREAVDRFASMRGGSMRRAGWISTIRVSCTRCWWTCAPGWLPRGPRAGSSTAVLEVAKAAGLVAGGGCWTRQRCMTRWPRWTGHPGPLGDPGPAQGRGRRARSRVAGGAGPRGRLHRRRQAGL